MKSPKEVWSQAVELVSKMTLQERASLMSGSSFWHLQPIERFGLDAIMVADGPHGLRKADMAVDQAGLNASVPATCFPTAVTLASSWDIDLLQEVGAAIGRECQAEDVAVLLGPGVNIKRNPLCGRNFEYYSEDPFLSGKLAAKFIQGVQSTGIGTSLKHFAANNQESRRMVVDTLVDRRTLFELYLPAFEIAVKEAQPWTVMCAYNKLNGTFCSEHRPLLNDILRDRWGFEGLVVTDWGAINDRPKAVSAGLELEMPSSGGVNDDAIARAVEQNALAEEDLDRAAQRVSALMLAAQNNSERSKVDFDAHHDLARKCAAEGAVLLKNQDRCLPFKTARSLAVIGAFAETPRIQGAGSSQVNATRIEKPLEVFRKMIGAKVTYAPGFDPELAEDNPGLIEEAVAVAEKAEQVLILAGLPPLFEAEGFDRTTLKQPAQIDRLIEAVSAANPNCAVILSNGSPIEMPWLDQVPAVLETYLGGQAGAEAMADLVFGKQSPSGKLAETFPLSLEDVPSQPNFANHPRQIVYREGLNVGYRAYGGAQDRVLFPFGHGLSYTEFSYDKLKVSGQYNAANPLVQVTLEVTNSGACSGAEIIQLYVRDCEASVYRPDRELKGFQKLSLASSETKTCSFELDARAFAYFDLEADDWQIEPGTFELLIGASCCDIRLSSSVEITGEESPAYPPKAQQPYYIMDDEALADLGLHMTPPDPIRPYSVQTALEDIKDHWLGKRLVAKVMEMMREHTGGQTPSPVVQKMQEAIVFSMRLSTLRNMSGGAITQKRLDILIHVLNGAWLGAVTRLFRR